MFNTSYDPTMIENNNYYIINIVIITLIIINKIIFLIVIFVDSEFVLINQYYSCYPY